jgi:hypothetical protein
MVLLGIVMGIFGSRDVLMVSQSSYSPPGRLPPSPSGRYPPSSTPTSTCSIITSPLPPSTHSLILTAFRVNVLFSSSPPSASAHLGFSASPRSQLTPRRNQRIRPPTFHRRSRIRPHPPQGSCRNSSSRMRRRRYWTSSPCFRLHEARI